MGGGFVSLVSVKKAAPGRTHSSAPKGIQPLKDEIELQEVQRALVDEPVAEDIIRNREEHTMQALFFYWRERR